MPSKLAGFHRLPKILDMLTRMDPSHRDRPGVEKLFGPGPRRARQLMAGLAGIRAGNAAAISRAGLIWRMEETAASQLYQGSGPPGPRRRRLGPDPARNRRPPRPGPRIPRGGPAPFQRPPRSHSAHARRVLIAFPGAADLAAKLVELSQAMTHGWTGFMRAVEK